MEKAKNIGVKVNLPKKECTDKKCPFHGELKVRGRYFVGKIVRPVFHKTVVIEFQRQFYIPKFERYEKRMSRIKAYVPPCLELKQGDTIRIMETRKLAKTKNFVALGVEQ
ncbi:MAG TPA: 30S ribosomal protein S17 [Candidatus Nanoarchaeia archaeon]|nr:30S ribosomal protein S17 [Candidatus Nanoarchaeia archaeon]